ncbi:hypothetical protein [Micromonospora cathayae]|uniref:DUF222 domain-containing protein n=1 Tax=Micromonospora cathayae TaxID=3028804 RepID=A0ABY7ZKC7_9ACTN|nr:hypothetical protein [Micromonospora sp. HUAS 3]WDZ82901.1 hypothetical protein PVK37_20775 [Micromonospora sp. HUAS 3]
MHDFDPVLDRHDHEPLVEWPNADREPSDAYETLEGEWGQDDENMELEFATRLLDATGEDELDRLVADLLGSAPRGGARFARTREGRQIGGILRDAASRVQPILSRGRDRPVGWNTGRGPVDPVAPAARRYFGVNVEGLSPEDQELELARSFVRFAREAVHETERRAGSGPPGRVVHHAAVTAANHLAPGLISDDMLAATGSGQPTRDRDAGSTVARIRDDGETAADDRCPVCGSEFRNAC